MPDLRYEKVRKVFHTRNAEVIALNNVSFVIGEGELFCLLGPSGCGKTTLLRCTAGLERLDGGRIYYGDTDFTAIPPFRRDIGMVFQNYALYPHMTVYDNVAYPLRIRKLPRREIDRRVREIMELVDLPGVLRRNPSELSGGQQQRVALARALVYQPKLLLLDEPLANLDAKLKVYMRTEIRRIQKQAGVTTLYVTHDQQEAMAIADRLGVMEGGVVRQIGTPSEIYDDPANEFVAGFIGEMNFFPARIVSREGEELVVEVGAARKRKAIRAGAELRGEEVTVALRPEHLRIFAPMSGEGTFRGTIQVIQFLGKFVRYQVAIAGGVGLVEVDMPSAVPGLREGDKAAVDFDSRDMLVFSAGDRVA